MVGTVKINFTPINMGSLMAKGIGVVDHDTETVRLYFELNPKSKNQCIVEIGGIVDLNVYMDECAEYLNQMLEIK